MWPTVCACVLGCAGPSEPPPIPAGTYDVELDRVGQWGQCTIVVAGNAATYAVAFVGGAYRVTAFNPQAPTPTTWRGDVRGDRVVLSVEKEVRVGGCPIAVRGEMTLRPVTASAEFAGSNTVTTTLCPGGPECARAFEIRGQPRPDTAAVGAAH